MYESGLSKLALIILMLLLDKRNYSPLQYYLLSGQSVNFIKEYWEKSESVLHFTPVYDIQAVEL